MASATENCLHLWGLRPSARSEYRCPACGEKMDLEGVARWVREAERTRDESYSLVEGERFGDIVREELQREVYRRRRVMYDLQSVPRVATARPEMILVVYNARSASYECRIFYKEPRPAGVVEQLSVEADGGPSWTCAPTRIPSCGSRRRRWRSSTFCGTGSQARARRRRAGECSTRTSSRARRWRSPGTAARIGRPLLFSVQG